MATAGDQNQWKENMKESGLPVPPFLDVFEDRGCDARFAVGTGELAPYSNVIVNNGVTF